MNPKKITMIMLRSAIASWILTAIAAAVLAFMAFLLHFNDGIINAGVVFINILACFFGGFMAGKGIKEKKYLWGLIVGALYFALMLSCSCIFSSESNGSAAAAITSALICLGSGMLGGMLG